jgi:hypothetical protein
MAGRWTSEFSGQQHPNRRHWLPQSPLLNPPPPAGSVIGGQLHHGQTDQLHDAAQTGCVAAPGSLSQYDCGRQPSELLFVSCLTRLSLPRLPGLSRPPSRCLCALASRLPGRSADSACWVPEDCLPSLRSPEPAAGMPGVGCSVNWRPAPPHLEVPPPPLFDVEAEPRWSEVAPALVAAQLRRPCVCRWSSGRGPDWDPGGVCGGPA